ncbi:MAG: RnfH family protein [Xanthomonadaceae bacterium]|nr:RnfH family protein [Xanthomonadaceae bacterium]
MATRDAGMQRLLIDLPADATIAEALSAAAITLPDGAAAAVYGRVKALDDRLNEGERLEICLPLKADPKQARRSRERLRRSGRR